MSIDSTKAERVRLKEARESGVPWRKWGPYLSERQWGTVREDYSDNGNAWDYFSHDQARSRAYRWGEDGLGGYSDEKQYICFGIALWNGVDPILKERCFGLTNSEGNHGEDVKEYYFYLDSTPTHSYMRYLYKYPQRPFPYDQLVRTNRELTRDDPEYELVDTGVFDHHEYFDVFIDYVKSKPEETQIEITVVNRGPASATLHLLPQVWFRNTWSHDPAAERPELRRQESDAETSAIRLDHPDIGGYEVGFEGAPPLWFTENETNNERLFHAPNRTPYVKDAFHRYLIQGEKAAVNPAETGTKAAAHYAMTVPAGGQNSVRLVLRRAADASEPFPWRTFAAMTSLRKQEADEFYQSITPSALSADQALVMRQALAGMLWTKQYYYFDLDKWLEEHGASPMSPFSHRHSTRNREWFHMVNDDIISMPDKWEYPWYAAWDLAFHCTALALVDIDFAKSQLDLMLKELYLHPNGQIPAYEWNFGDVNPPVHALATIFVYSAEVDQRGHGDIEFLKSSFQKLLLNFTWWVNRKDPTGRNVFQGGFLGLDNIGVFDRSAPLPTGGHLEQADGTAWMAMYCQNMLEIALELARHDAAYEEICNKFIEHFFWIASAMDRIGDNHDEMWDEQDGFFYDLLRLPDGSATRLRVRSLVGLLPLCATTVVSDEICTRFPRIIDRARKFMERHPEVAATVHPAARKGFGDRRLLAIIGEDKLRRILSRMLDESEFLSPHGIRSVSRFHQEHPYAIRVHGEEFRVDYLPAESNTGMFGGNSNWRGPVWMPVNLLLIRALLQYFLYYGDTFRVECPTGSGRMMNLFEVAEEIGRRLSAIFLRDASGHRPVYGGTEIFQQDPHWRDLILFYEYFHGDNGAGIGASHQTGWTGIVSRLLQMSGHLHADDVLEGRTTRPLTDLFGGGGTS